MKTINITPEYAENALVLIAQHAPTGVVIGRPQIGYRWPDTGEIGILTDTEPPSLWFVDTGAVSRLVEFGDGRREVTEFRGGVEVERAIG